MFERGSERFNLFFFKRFKKIIIPDYKTDDLSGDLSHNLDRINENNLHYVGVLSDFKKKNLKKDIDYFVSLSGPEPQRSILEKKILSEIHDLTGKIVISLGKTEYEEKMNNESIKIFTYLSKEEREEVLNKSKLVISRSGYSTIMDLAVIGTKALMIPTPGQIEQEYLAAYHNSKNTFYSVNQQDLSLRSDAKKAQGSQGCNKPCDVSKSVEQIIQLISER
jgi:UDP-N-acetylglucosamine transferase subunit ALG13